MDYRSPRYTSPLSNLSPVSSRGAKRTRSRTFSASHDDSDLLSLRTRNISPSAHYPTPPLSASSSCSSNSSLASTHFPSAFSAFPWRPESAGPPMTLDGVTIHESPDDYATPAPDLDLEAKQRTRRHLSAEPPSRHLPMHAPLAVDAAHYLAARALDAAVLAPKAPGWETEGVPTDGQKPWLQQEYVEGLIGVSMLAIDSIWSNTKAKDSPDSSPSGSGEVLPLKFFILETLRRSRSNAVVLQVALYYLHKVRSRIRDRVAKAEQAKDRFSHLARVRHQQQHSPPTGYPTPPSSPTMDEFTEAAAEVLATSKDPVICGRRMFLASLICASKFLLDRTYSNRAWSRLSGLPVSEINANERAFLGLLDYRLYVGGELMGNWMARLKKLQEAQGILPQSPSSPRKGLERTQSDIFTVNSLPMQELHASDHNGTSVARPVLPSSVQRSHSSASLPSHFLPDIALNPRAGEHGSKPVLQRTATFGLSRSVSGSRPHPAGVEHLPSPLRRPCLPTRDSRSCSVSSSLGGTPDRLAHLQAAY